MPEKGVRQCRDKKKGLAKKRGGAFKRGLMPQCTLCILFQWMPYIEGGAWRSITWWERIIICYLKGDVIFQQPNVVIRI